MKKTVENKKTFKINSIHIMMDLNTDDKPVLFNYSMLSTPDIPKGKSYNYPYFTNSLKYNESFISNLVPEYLMKFFFNKQEFSKIVTKMLNTENNNYIDYKKNLEELGNGKGLNANFDDIFEKQSKQEMENEQHNIMITLKYLFPIYPKFNEYLKRSDYLLTGKIQPAIFAINTNDVIDSMNYFGWMNRVGALSKERGASYLNVGKGGPMIVKSVTWENDIVNHPVYSEFIKVYNLRMNDIDNNISDITEKRRESENLFVSKVEKYMDKELDVSSPMNAKEFKSITNTDVVNSNLLDFYYDIKNNKKQKSFPITGKNETNPSKVFFTSSDMGVNTIYDRIFNKWLDIESSTKSYSSSKTNEMRSSAQIIMKELKEFLESVLDYREKKDTSSRQKLIDTHKNLVKILDENYAMKSKIGSLFDFGDGERAMNDLIFAAVDLKTIERIENFVTNKELFNTETRRDDDSPKIESETRIIKRLNDAYPVYVELSKSLVNTLKSVLPPDRKTSNPELYKLLSKTKIGTWGNESGKDKKVIEEIYNRFIKKADSDPSVDIIHFLYTGVDTVIGKKENTEGDVKEQTNEIYVRIDLINKSEYESSSNCRVKDNQLKNNLQYLLETDYPYTTMNPNREYIMVDKDGDTKEAKPVSEEDKTVKRKKDKKVKKGGAYMRTRKNKYGKTGNYIYVGRKFTRGGKNRT